MIYFKQQLIEINQPTDMCRAPATMVLKLRLASEPWGGLVPSQRLGPTLKVSEVWLEPWDFLQVTR